MIAKLKRIAAFPSPFSLPLLVMTPIPELFLLDVPFSSARCYHQNKVSEGGDEGMTCVCVGGGGERERYIKFVELHGVHIN